MSSEADVLAEKLSYARSRAIHYFLRLTTGLYTARMPASLRDLLRDLRKARSTGIGDYDALALYRAVTKRQPRFILELGAGQSTAVIALAIKDAGYPARFIAVEEDPKWLAHHIETTPEHLRPLVEFKQSDVAVRTVGDVKAAHYVDLPRLPYELVHVDGPQLANNGVKVSCDAIDLKEEFGNRCLIMLDAREETARLLRRELAPSGFSSRRHPFTFMPRLVR